MAQQLTHLMASLVTTDDGNEDKDIQQPKIYAKDSMDRFGDDMYGLILSYLSLEDRFRLECMSKQFQRTVFASVVDIELNDQLIRKILKTKTTFTQTMETIAKKFPNIQTIDCRGMICNNNGLQIFHDNCRYLRHIYCNMRSNRYQLIPKLRPLVTRINGVSTKQSLTNYHRLSHLSVTFIDNVFDQNFGLMAKNLLGFEFTFKLKNFNNQLLSRFVAENQSLRYLVIKEIKFNTRETLNELTEQLSRLPQLRRLRLEFQAFPKHYPLADSLRTIGVNCKQLKRLSLVLNSQTTQIKVSTLDSLEVFRQLKRFDLTIDSQWFSQRISGQRLTY
ncbi:unnamed protein product [Medioppia subpectinata]|uniref:F-box domain-containing protein n=1 Tax=Medioppia subpectinata TaxID=1979941 RepID=A0A7R9KCG2_9ACAR|nr:unnamed protein product [Medioppia subpectinata]CAG2100550.1 unnamed protein product [Medioppia subpectinata]